MWETRPLFTAVDEGDGIARSGNEKCIKNAKNAKECRKSAENAEKWRKQYEDQ